MTETMQGGRDPYDVLGVTEMDSLEEIEAERERLLREARESISEARREDDTEKYERNTKKMRRIEEAWDCIEENHEPPAADEPVSIEVVSSDTIVDSPVKIRTEGNSGPIETLVIASRDGDEIDSRSTDRNGEATFRFEKYGPVQLTAPTTSSYEDETEIVSIDRKPVSLNFQNPPDSVEVNQQVEFTVKSEGTPEDSVEISSENQTLGRTSGNGTIRHTFQSVGDRKITGSKDDTDERTYSNCKTELEVTEETVSLRGTVDGSNYEVGDTLTVNISAPNGDVAGAEVSAGDVSKPVGSDGKGKVNVPLKSKGELEIRATKSAPKEDRTYKPWSTKVSVAPEQRSLRIEEIEGERMQTNDITVHVVDDDNNALPGVTVETNWTKHNKKTTEDDGTVKFDLYQSGRLQITASKETDEVDYGDDNKFVDIDEFSREIKIVDAPDLVSPGDEVTIHVQDSEGNDLKGAKVTSSEQTGESYETEENGKAKFNVVNRTAAPKITVRMGGEDFEGEEATTTFRILDL